MSKVLVNNLIVRAAPSTTSEEIAQYNAGEIINSGDLLIENEEGIWLRYTGQSGNKRYVMAYNKDNTPYVDVASHIPNPFNPCRCGGRCDFCCITGLPGIPKQIQFPDHRIQKWGCIFLCTCVKGGLTTFGQCMDCFQWGMTTGKLRSNDCYVNDKEQWAREISSRYGTLFHGDYIFQKSNRPHFWLTQGGREIYNSMGIGYH